MADAATRKKVFDGVIESYDQAAAKENVDLAKHSHLAIEHDGRSNDSYLSGWPSLRAACDYLAEQVEAGDSYVPDFIVNLDTGERIDLGVHVSVVPSTVDAVVALLPRPVAEHLHSVVVGRGSDTKADKQAATILKRAIDRR